MSDILPMRHDESSLVGVPPRFKGSVAKSLNRTISQVKSVPLATNQHAVIVEQSDWPKPDGRGHARSTQKAWRRNESTQLTRQAPWSFGANPVYVRSCASVLRLFGNSIHHLGRRFWLFSKVREGLLLCSTSGSNGS
jgi:hypothetical protein